MAWLRILLNNEDDFQGAIKETPEQLVKDKQVEANLE